MRPPGDALAGLAQLHVGPRRQTCLSELGLCDEAVAWWARSLGHALGQRLARRSSAAALPPWGLRSMHTPGDGNCLLHALLQATLGVCDTRLPASSDEPGASTLAELDAGARPRGRGCVLLGGGAPWVLGLELGWGTECRAEHVRAAPQARSCPSSARASLASARADLADGDFYMPPTMPHHHKPRHT